MGRWRMYTSWRRCLGSIDESYLEFSSCLQFVLHMNSQEESPLQLEWGKWIPMQPLCSGLYFTSLYMHFGYRFYPLALAVLYALHSIVWLNLPCGTASQPGIIAFKATIEITKLFHVLLSFPRLWSATTSSFYFQCRQLS